MNQSFLAAINVATSYKPIVDPFRLARLYNHIQSGLTLLPDCFLSCMLACISFIMIFTTKTLTKSMQFRLSRRHVATKSSPEHLTGKHTKMNHYRIKHKVWHKRQQSCTSTLPSMQTTMLATSTDQYKQPNSFSVDTDGVYFMINNSANGGICNIKPMFVGDFERHSVTLVTACLISSILPLSSGSNVQLHIMRHSTQNKRHAIGVTPTREMRLESHLQTCD